MSYDIDPQWFNHRNNDGYWADPGASQQVWAKRPPCDHFGRVYFDLESATYKARCVHCNTVIALEPINAELLRSAIRACVDSIIDENDPDTIEELYVTMVKRCQEVDELVEDIHAYRELADALSRYGPNAKPAAD